MYTYSSELQPFILVPINKKMILAPKHLVTRGHIYNHTLKKIIPMVKCVHLCIGVIWIRRKGKK